METHVERLELNVFLDDMCMLALVNYSLQGKCKAVKLREYIYKLGKRRKMMRTWAKRGNWKMVTDDPGYIEIKRK